MKKLFPILLILAFLGGLAQTAHAESEKPKNKEILSAFDVATLRESGSSDADIAKLLAEQRGVNKDSATIQGKPDQQVIYYLLTYAKPKGKVPDLGKTVTHKAQGATALKEGLSKKAAEEFSLAINFSENDYEPYKSRADSYMQFLEIKPVTAPVTTTAEDKPAVSKEMRSLLCNSIYNDNHYASLLNNNQIQSDILAMDRLRDRMLELRDNPDPSVDYKRKSYENILNMRLLQQVYYRQREAYQAGVNIRKAQTEYNTLCANEEANRKNMVRLATR